MWRAGSAITRPPPGVIVLWHLPQSLSTGCGGGGGVPWQLPHSPSTPLTTGHTGFFAVPPPSDAPWQYVFAHVEPFHVALPASALKMTSAGSALSMWPID